MRRREFVGLIGGAAASPLLARAQQPERMRRVAYVTTFADDAEARARIRALTQGLAALGWIEGRNFFFDHRFAAGDVERVRAHVADLIPLAPDIVITNNTPVVAALKAATSTIPIVFMGLVDPVEQGFVAGLARPGGNITGFTNIELPIIGKMLGLLSEMAPGLRRAAILFNPATGPFVGTYLRSFEGIGRSSTVSVAPAEIRDAADIDRTIAELGREPGSGLIVPPDSFVFIHHMAIIKAAELHRVPTIYSFRSFIQGGALMSYGPDILDIFRRAASYVDRVLRGDKPAELPVQQPVKYELAINMKTAKALGLNVPLTLQVAADEIIE